MTDRLYVCIDGEKLYLDDPDPSFFGPVTAARSLSRIPRFCGHTGEITWSVAAHSLVVALSVPKPAVGYALVHDIPEMVTSDIPDPVKRWIGDRIWELEGRLLRAVFECYGLGDAENDVLSSVVTADVAVREWERSLFQGEGERNDPISFRKVLRLERESRHIFERALCLLADGLDVYDYLEEELR